MLLCIENAGCEGADKVIELLLSIRMTEAMVGLWATFSWTHNNPMWMHWIILVFEPTPNVGSIIFEVAMFFQFFHAYKII